MRQRTSEASKIDITGKRYGRLIVTGLAKSRGKPGLAWYVKCDCGNTTVVLGGNLKTGNTTSCGCYGKQRISETQRLDVTNQRFGRLVALYPSKQVKRHFVWHCKCDCGNETDVNITDLTSGHTKSCSCYNKDKVREANTKHGLCKTPEYARQQTRKRKEIKNHIDTEWTSELEALVSDFFCCCVLCGEILNLATDHVYPLSKGYGLRIGNAIRLCKRCNSRKGNKTPEELSVSNGFKVLMAARSFQLYTEVMNENR